MSDDKKYYYMRLKEDFFNDDAVKILESMPDGYIYSNILLKLYLCSLKGDGKLMLNNTIPYSPEMLAALVGHQVGTVQKAVDIFQKLGLIDILDSGAIYMLNIQNFIGRSSTEADRVRIYRSKINDEKTDVVQMYDKHTPEIEIEIEKDIEINKNINAHQKNDDERVCSESAQKEDDLVYNFGLIYAIYPKKIGKERAFKSYKGWIKGKKTSSGRTKLTNKQIYDAVQAYLATKTEGTELQYYKGFDTLMNNITDYVEEK